ncbi:MAG: molybdopterin-binding protein, partial [Erythrobacter sp.]|nr:molybdopterin-binding protein [Erythrobacter sp.]
MSDIKRRTLLTGLAAFGAGACTEMGKTDAAASLFDIAEDWHREAHRTLAGRQRLAPEYAPEDRSPDVKGNG